MKWVTRQSDVIAQNIVTSEFQWISRESDVLVHAFSPRYGDFLVLNELQLRYTSQMPRRMHAYAALAEERYRLPTYLVLINILPPAASVTIASGYTSEFMGLQARQDFHLINLWEADVNIVYQQRLSALLPLVQQIMR